MVCQQHALHVQTGPCGGSAVLDLPVGSAPTAQFNVTFLKECSKLQDDIMELCQLHSPIPAMHFKCFALCAEPDFCMSAVWPVREEHILPPEDTLGTRRMRMKGQRIEG